MEVPTLTKKQIKSSLSMKKSKNKEVIKNVLSSPYVNSFWPEVSIDDHHKVKVVLEKHLPQIKPKKINVPWKEIKNVPKTERKKFRMKFGEGMNIDNPTSLGKLGLILGINDVTKGLEQDSLSAVLISNDVQPRLMVQHIIDQTILRKVPVLIISNLRELTKQRCGISSVTLGIEKNTPEKSLVTIKNCVEKLFMNIPPPNDHVNFNRSEIFKTEQFEEEKSKIVENKSDEEDIPNWEEIMSSVYLKKEGNNNSRVFTPEARKKLPEMNSSLQMEIDDSIVVSTESKKRKSAKYKSLKVKRLKGDPERTKKKIRKLKKS